MIRFARLESSPRLQRLHAFLSQGGWHTTREINWGAEVQAVNSAVCELRQQGFDIRCKQIKVKDRRAWAYRMISPPAVGVENPAPVAKPAPEPGAQSKLRRNRMLSAIHAESNRRGIGETDRRALQRSVTGKDSCTNMSDAELRIVLDAIKAPRVAAAVNSRTDSSLPRMKFKITRLCLHLGVGGEYADGISARMFKKKVATCDAEQLRGVIAALTKRLETADASKS